MRIGYACKLLSLDNMIISQISTECGFDTISHFNKSFKKNKLLFSYAFQNALISVNYPGQYLDYIKKAALHIIKQPPYKPETIYWY